MTERSSPGTGTRVIRITEDAFQRLHRARVRIMASVNERPDLYPDYVGVLLSMGDIVSLLLDTIPKEYTDG